MREDEKTFEYVSIVGRKSHTSARKIYGDIFDLFGFKSPPLAANKLSEAGANIPLLAVGSLSTSELFLTAMCLKLV